MRHRRILAVLFVVLAIGSWGTSTAQARRHSTCDGSHGAYTSTLCPGDALVESSYLISGNGDYRFYLQDDGSTVAYDTSDDENWVPLYNVWSTVSAAHHFVYAGNYYADTFGHLNWQIWGSSDNFLVGSYWGEPDGVHFMRLDNDGCLRIYDQDGGRVITAYCAD